MNVNNQPDNNVGNERTDDMQASMHCYQQYPHRHQRDLFAIYEDQTNPLRPDHSLLEVVIERLEAPDACLYVIKDDDQSGLLGAGMVSGHEHRELQYCCVRPEWRRQGIGLQLTQHIIEQEAKQGHRALHTTIDREDHTARQFLINLGFSESADMAATHTTNTHHDNARPEDLL